MCFGKLSIAFNLLKTPRYLFVTGVFRSGTSLLYACLNQHPDIALLYEAELQSHDLPKRLFLHDNWLENANAWGKFLFRHGFPPYPREASATFCCPEDFYNHYAARKNAIYGGEKSPLLIGFLPQLVERFPEAKIITISRHPAAISRSIQLAASSESWFARGSMMERALYGQEALLQDSIRLANDGHSLLHLTYEEFTAHPEAECRRICSYLELPFDARMTTLHGADLSPVYDHPHHIKLRSEKITATPVCQTDLSADGSTLLENHWQRSLTVLKDLRSPIRPLLPLPPVSGKIQRAIAKGRFLHHRTRWKRFIYHLLPGELIRIFRATKVLVRTSKSIQSETYTPAEMLRIRLVSNVLNLFFLALGTLIHTGSHGELSPLPFFIFPVLASGWFFGWKQIGLFSLLSAAAWTLGPRFTFSPHMPLLWLLWNLLSRTSVLFILGFFAWHLKATLLLHQNQKD